jgi:large subunit ribosomal protein L25
MSTVLVAETGRSTGSANARRMRREDHIPAVVYGQGMSPISVTVARRDLRIALSGSAGMNTVLDLKIDGKTYPAIVKDMQRHPVRRTVAHIDFLQVNLNEEIVVAVPLRLEGEAKAVLQGGGLVDPAVDTIEVSTTPRDIPDEIVVDITDMTMDSVITIGDLTLPAGVTPVAEADFPIVTVLMTSQAEAPSRAMTTSLPATRLPRPAATPLPTASDRPHRSRRCRLLSDGPVRPAHRQGHPVRLARRRAGQSRQGVRAHPPQRGRGVRPGARRTARHLAQGRARSGAVGETRFGTGIDAPRVVLAFPITFMNESGRAVAALVRRYQIESVER